MLLACLLALVLGVFGAVYFEQNLPGTPQVASNPPPAPPPTAGPAPPAAATPPQAVTSAPENNAALQAVPPRESTPAQSAEAPSPPSSSSTAAQNLAQIAPSAAPANVAAAAPRYWVEFGAYEGSFYADRLKQNLAKLGIATTVTEARGAHGRKYLRVRGDDQGDHAAATAQSSKAQDALHIAPLLHRVAAVSSGATRATPSAAAARASLTHWVQFGAFRAPQNANSVLIKLHKNNIQAIVIKTKKSIGSALYLVRVANLPDRATASRIAQQGSAALHSHDVLVGQSARPANLNPRAPPR